MVTKSCPKCRRVLTLDKFYLYKRRGRQERSCWCSSCQRERSSARHLERRDCPEYKKRAKERTLRSTYGIGLEDVAAFKKKQNGKCPICLRLLAEVSREHVDHCHSTKRVRGVLCSECNTGIGKLKDDPAYLRRAVRYLTK